MSLTDLFGDVFRDDIGDTQPPAWVTQRGGDVRAFDLGDGRDVYGPGHVFGSGDLMLTNGMIRATVIEDFAQPQLHLEAFNAGTWTDFGYVQFSADGVTGVVIREVAIKAITPEAATVRIELQGLGASYVVLRRGERMVRLQHGENGALSALRFVDWSEAGPPDITSNVTGAGFCKIDDAYMVNGLRPGLVTLQSGVNGLAGHLAIFATTAVQRLDVGIVVGTDPTANDTVESLQAQLAAACSQEVRVR